MEKIKYNLSCLFFFLFISITLPAQADQKIIEALQFGSDYINPQLSPDGKHLAVQYLDEGEYKLVILSTKDFQVKANLYGRSSLSVGDFHWISNDRVLIESGDRFAQFAGVYRTGELYSVQINGKSVRPLFGARLGEQQTGTRIQKRKFHAAFGELLDPLSDDPKHILIKATPFSKTGARANKLYKLDVQTGKIKKKFKSPPIFRATYITDYQGNPRIAYSVDSKRNKKIFVKQTPEEDWKQIFKNFPKTSFYPIAFDQDGKVFILANFNQDKLGLYRFDLTDESYEEIYTDKEVDIESAMLTTDRKSVYAVQIYPDYPVYVITNKSAPEAQVLKNFVVTFPHHKIDILSRDDQGDLWVVKVSNEKNPGSYYIYNQKNNTLQLLFHRKEWLESLPLGKMTAVAFEASDGQEIRGYLTTPSIESKVKKTIVLVHGGPHGPRDYWGYNTEVQTLVAHGYQVLQVNFRGSGGYGQSFLASGYQKWGTRIQQDILDGIDWGIKSGQIDPKHICIMGTSFGAYSAVQSATMRPDLFKCVIANAGLYDLRLMHSEGDIPEWYAGNSYLDTAIGTDKKQLAAQSPIMRLKYLKAPVFLAHGSQDRRTPPIHAKRLKAALEQQNHSFEWYYRSREGHGFRDHDNRVEYFSQVIAFIEKHI